MLKRLLPRYLQPGFYKDVIQEVRLAWELFWDPRVPRRAKIIPMLTLGYLISPFDIIAFIPVIGQLDDLAILLLSTRFFVRVTPQHLVNEHRAKLGMPVKTS